MAGNNFGPGNTTLKKTCSLIFKKMAECFVITTLNNGEVIWLD